MKSDYIPDSTWRTLYHEMQYENALAIRTSLETGLRIGDVVSLPASSLHDGCVHYTAQKTGKAGVARLSAGLFSRLKAISGKKYVFTGRLSNDKHRTRQAVYRDLCAVADRYGVSVNVTPHSARKTYAVNVYHADGIKAAGKALQHDRESTTLIYALSDKISAERLRVRPDNDDQIEAIAGRVVALLSERLGLPPAPKGERDSVAANDSSHA